MRRWFRKIVRVFLVVVLGAIGSLPFRRVPPPGLNVTPSADRLVLQNDSHQTVQELPLQIAPPAAPPDVQYAEQVPNPVDGTRTADKRAPQTSRKDLPTWNSRLESTEPPPPLPDSFERAGPSFE